MKPVKDEASPNPQSAPISPPTKRLSLDATLFSRDRYKLWALAALLLLAVWSMLTGSLTLKSSAGDPASQLSAFSTASPDDLDVLEVADREKVVKKLWNVYIHGYGGFGSKIRLPRFWEEAFQAAYESLVSDASDVRDNAISEIAKMSLFNLDLLTLPAKSTGAAREAGKRASSRKLKAR